MERKAVSGGEWMGRVGRGAVHNAAAPGVASTVRKGKGKGKGKGNEGVMWRPAHRRHKVGEIGHTLVSRCIGLSRRTGTDSV